MALPTQVAAEGVPISKHTVQASDPKQRVALGAAELGINLALLQAVSFTLTLPRQAQQTLEVELAAELAHLRAALGLSLFVTQALNAGQAAQSLPLAVTPITHSPHLGHLQHEPLCTNRRKQRRPASAGY